MPTTAAGVALVDMMRGHFELEWASTERQLSERVLSVEYEAATAAQVRLLDDLEKAVDRLPGDSRYRAAVLAEIDRRRP